MQYSKAGEALTERFESCRLTAYQDVRGIWTIGWGHTGLDVVEGLTWTQEQADATLLSDTESAQDTVNHLVSVSLSQNEFDSLVDFVFNVGYGNFARSTLRLLLNAGQYKAAALEFDKWDHSGGKVVAGLLRRREAETAEFNEA